MLFQFHAELVVWTAHEMKTAKEGFRRLVALETEPAPVFAPKGARQ